MKNSKLFKIFIFIGLVLISCEKGKEMVIFNKPVNYPKDSIVAKLHDLTLLEGVSRELYVEYNTADNATWNSDDISVATVTEDGVVTAGSAGETYLRVKCQEYNGAQDSVRVNVVKLESDNHLPQLCLNQSATKQQIYDFYSDKQATTETNEQEIIVKGSNFLILYLMTSGDRYDPVIGDYRPVDEPYLRNIVMAVWGKKENIITELTEEYNATMLSNGNYKSDNAEYYMNAEYVGAKDHHEMRRYGVVTDFYYIVFGFNEW